MHPLHQQRAGVADGSHGPHSALWGLTLFASELDGTGSSCCGYVRLNIVPLCHDIGVVWRWGLGSNARLSVLVRFRETTSAIGCGLIGTARTPPGLETKQIWGKSRTKECGRSDGDSLGEEKWTWG